MSANCFNTYLASYTHIEDISTDMLCKQITRAIDTAKCGKYEIWYPKDSHIDITAVKKYVFEKNYHKLCTFSTDSCNQIGCNSIKWRPFGTTTANEIWPSPDWVL